MAQMRTPLMNNQEADAVAAEPETRTRANEGRGRFRRITSSLTMLFDFHNDCHWRNWTAKDQSLATAREG